jgi:hypothetical protein
VPASRRATTALVVALATAAAVVLYVVDPSQHALTPPCAFRTFTGLACPGCGLTRAAHALLHGDLAQAFSLNPWGFVSGPLLAGFLAAPAVTSPAVSHRTRTVLAWTGAILTLAFWIWRNTPGYPFATVT